MKHPGDSSRHPEKTDSRHFIAIWKWADWLARIDDDAAYHSDARILTQMAIGHTLWLLTRDPVHQRLHLVEAFQITRQKPEGSRPPWRYGVEGNSLFDKATKVRWLERDWFPVFTQLVTLKGTSLQSRDAPHFCQRIMQPRVINQTSSDLLHQSASK